MPFLIILKLIRTYLYHNSLNIMSPCHRPSAMAGYHSLTLIHITVVQAFQAQCMLLHAQVIAECKLINRQYKLFILIAGLAMHMQYFIL